MPRKESRLLCCNCFNYKVYPGQPLSRKRQNRLFRVDGIQISEYQDSSSLYKSELSEEESSESASSSSYLSAPPLYGILTGENESLPFPTFHSDED